MADDESNQQETSSREDEENAQTQQNIQRHQMAQQQAAPRVQPGNETGADMNTSAEKVSGERRFADLSKTSDALRLLGAGQPYQPGSY